MPVRNEFDYSDESESAETTLDMTRIWQFVRRRRWVMIIGTLVALVPAFIYPFQQPAIYRAEATVALQQRPEVMDIGAEIIASGPRRHRQMVASMASLVRSSAVLGRIVDQLPTSPRDEASDPSLIDQIKAKAGFGSLPPRPSPDQVRQMRVQQLMSRIEVEGDGGGTVLRIAAWGFDPVEVTFLSNATADALADYRRDQHSGASRKALTWLNEQTYELRRRSDDRQRAIDDLVRQSGISIDTSSAAKRDELQKQVDAAEIELMVVERRLKEARAANQKRVNRFEQTEETQRQMDQYREARAALDAARLTYTETHPHVRRLEAVVRGLTAKIDPQLVDLFGQTEGANAAGQVERLTAERAALSTRVVGLKLNLEGVANRVQGGTEVQNKYDQLTRELQVDRQMLEVLLKRRNETMLGAATEHPGVTVLDYAVPPGGPISPNRPMLLLVGIVAAFAFGGGMGVLLELFDSRVREPEEVTDALGVPMLALVPASGEDEVIPERQCATAVGEPASEAYRNLRTSLLFSMSRGDLDTLLVTSAVAGEGKTTVSANLASSFALMGRKVLLVDADMRRARAHRVFDLARSPGLSEVLRGTTRLEDAVQRPEGAEFDVLAAGSLPDNPSELITSAKRDLIMVRIKNQYDLVILDSPVLLAVSDALILSADADATVLVHKLGSIDRRALRRIRADLERAKANVLGVVFNQVDRGDPYVYPAYLESPYHNQPEGESKSWLRRRIARSK
ncbi:MAG: polysaccharide biosynthesis tyrosine autokinase [bacterium]|nr:polysaccharide biosynthesis tyrosine autokinase [bacterium]